MRNSHEAGEYYCFRVQNLYTKEILIVLLGNTRSGVLKRSWDAPDLRTVRISEKKTAIVG